MLIERLKTKYGEDSKISIDYSNCLEFAEI